MGHLVRRPERGNLPKVQWETNEEFRVVSINPQTDAIRLVKTFLVFEQARLFVDNLDTEGLYFYIHGQENRVLYSREEG